VFIKYRPKRKKRGQVGRDHAAGYCIIILRTTTEGRFPIRVGEENVPSKVYLAMFSIKKARKTSISRWGTRSYECLNKTSRREKCSKFGLSMGAGKNLVFMARSKQIRQEGERVWK